jgi:hypothetical protein
LIGCVFVLNVITTSRFGRTLVILRLFDRLGFFLDRNGLRAYFTVFAEKRKEVLGIGRHDGWMDG